MTLVKAPPANSGLAVIPWEGLIASHESIRVYAGPLRYLNLVNSLPSARVLRWRNRYTSDTSLHFSYRDHRPSRSRNHRTGQTFWSLLIHHSSSLFRAAVERFQGNRGRDESEDPRGSGALNGRRESFEQMREYSFEKQVHELYGSTVFDVNESYMAVNLASLQRINLVRLQQELLKDAFMFRYGEQDSLIDFDRKMHRYSGFNCLISNK